MGILASNTSKETQVVINYRNVISKNLLLIFTRNPEPGKCKTRLAATVGDKTALDIYTFLLKHTATITEKLDCAKQVWYSEEIWEEDIWDNTIYEKKLQQGADLGARMANAFQNGFSSGYEKIIIIGSDMFDLGKVDLEAAFSRLRGHDFIVGPAKDGGYYLLGMNTFKPQLFQNKDWGKETVLADTLADLKDEKYTCLEERNDIDRYEDIADIDAFLPYIKHLKK